MARSAGATPITSEQAAGPPGSTSITWEQAVDRSPDSMPVASQGAAVGDVRLGTVLGSTAAPTTSTATAGPVVHRQERIHGEVASAHGRPGAIGSPVSASSSPGPATTTSADQLPVIPARPVPIARPSGAAGPVTVHRSAEQPNAPVPLDRTVVPPASSDRATDAAAAGAPFPGATSSPDPFPTDPAVRRSAADGRDTDIGGTVSRSAAMAAGSMVPRSLRPVVVGAPEVPLPAIAAPLGVARSTETGVGASRPSTWPVVSPTIDRSVPLDADLTPTPPAPPSPAAGAPETGATAEMSDQQVNDLVEKAYPHIMRRLRTELRLDHERKGRWTDAW